MFIIFNILEISIKELLKILILPHTKNIIKLLIQFSLILSLIKLRGCKNSNISRLRMIESNHYGKRFFLVSFGFYFCSDIVISRLMLSHLGWPKVITLSGAYCIINQLGKPP